MILSKEVKTNPTNAEKLFLKIVQKNHMFDDCSTFEEFEKIFDENFKKRCSKCKKSLFITKYTVKDNKEYYKLCDICRNQMRELSRSNNKKFQKKKKEVSDNESESSDSE